MTTIQTVSSSYSLLPKSNTEKILLLAILAVAAALRLYHIGQPYTDLVGWRESSVAMMAENFHQKNWNIFFPEINWAGTGETYNGREFQTVSYLAAILYKFIGYHDWVGRGISWAFGIWGLFAFYKLVEKVWDQKQALAATAILAITPFAVFMNRTFVPSPAMCALTTTSCWLLIEYLQTDKRKYLWLFTVIASWAFLTKITGMLAGLAMLYSVWYIYHQRGKLTIRAIAPIFLSALIIFAIVGSYYAWAAYLSHHYPPYHFAGAENWLWIDGLGVWLSKKFFLAEFKTLATDFLWGVPVLFLTGLGFFLSFLKYDQSHFLNEQAEKKPVYFFHWLLIGCAFFYLIGAKELIDNFHNFQIFNLVIAAFAGKTFMHIVAFGNAKRASISFRSLALLLILLVLSQRIFKNLYEPLYHEDYAVGKQLKQLNDEKEPVIVIGNLVGSPVGIFYAGTKGWVFPPAVGNTDFYSLPATDDEAITILADLISKGAGWFGITRENYTAIQRDLPELDARLKSYPTIEEEAFIIFQLDKEF